MKNILNLIGRSVPLFLKDIEEKETELMSKVTVSKFLVLGGAGSIGTGGDKRDIQTESQEASRS